MGKKSQAKGRKFERWWRDQCRGIWPEAATPIQGSGGTESSPDVAGTPFYWEAKTGKCPPFWAALRQAEKGAKEGKGCKTFRGRPMIPAAVVRLLGKRPVVVMFAEDFLEIARLWEAAGRGGIASPASPPTSPDGRADD